MPVAIVVGGSGAIGSATAQLLLRDGYRVALAGRNTASLETAKASMTHPDRVSCHSFDASDWEATQRAVAQIADAQEGFDVVINTAGIFLEPVSVEHLTPEHLNRTMAANFLTVASVTSAVAPYLRHTRGCITNVAATDAFSASPGFASEGASKGAVVAFSQHAAVDLGKYGIRVNVVAPGWVETPMSRDALVDLGVRGRNDLESPPLGRIGTAIEIAEVIRFVCSPEARYMTGSTVVVDGGLLSLMADARTPN